MRLVREYILNLELPEIQLLQANIGMKCLGINETVAPNLARPYLREISEEEKAKLNEEFPPNPELFEEEGEELKQILYSYKKQPKFHLGRREYLLMAVLKILIDERGLLVPSRAKGESIREYVQRFPSEWKLLLRLYQFAVFQAVDNKRDIDILMP